MLRKKIPGILALSVMLTAALLAGCGGLRPTLFLHPEYNFGYVERVAVVPFENLTNERGAASRASRYFIAQLLSSESFDVVEPGEVTRVLNEQATVRTGDLTKDQIIAVGQALGVQGLFLGTVNETSASRSGSAPEHVVTLVVRMVETETGETVWSATHTESGRGFWASLFGAGGRSQSEVMRRCVKKVLSTLVE
ncbi:MAG: CsgG/HfaB family protein [candidate division Zixibacteria bacterium]|nr:CsgG/HfaB family protein [candidate division Zixibacteria bacterium]MDH3937548.1 CsgG/HfaB family protein [candidate division Zixibacteria bacterium]MDH4034664.1 CsgG/HfaB family protein [candidate division Zixibacteria bacterium]